MLPPHSFLQAEINDNELFGTMDIRNRPRFTQERDILSSAHVNVALTRTVHDTFLRQIRLAGKMDEKWEERRRELVRWRDREKNIPKEWSKASALLYYNNQLFIPESEPLQTEIAQSCHDSRVGGHFGEGKIIEIVTREF